MLASLGTDIGRLHAVAAQDLTAPVPTCPSWTVTDLVSHVANTIGNVALRQLRGKGPIAVGVDPLRALDRVRAEFVAELQTRQVDDQRTTPLGRAFTPAQAAYFWLRRMTHEIAIHRVDAELALHEPVTAVPQDLAVDGITEMLDVLLRYGSREFPGQYAGLLSDWRGHWLLLTTGDVGWRITVTPAGIDTSITTRADARTIIGATPSTLLMWLYNRSDDVTIAGDPELARRTQLLLDKATS